MTARSRLAAAMSEDDLLNVVVDLAHMCGWLVHHQLPARTSKGWRSLLKGDPGIPDLTLVHTRRPRVVFAELKSASGRLTLGQQRWDAALRRVARRSGVEDRSEQGQPAVAYYVFRPDDWHSGLIREVLDA